MMKTNALGFKAIAITYKDLKDGGKEKELRKTRDLTLENDPKFNRVKIEKFEHMPCNHASPADQWVPFAEAEPDSIIVTEVNEGHKLYIKNYSLNEKN
jgi:hypothetical protein